MQKKILAGTIILAALTLFLGLGALNVTAQGPTATNTEPWTAEFTWGEPRTIQPGQALWFKFDYGSDKKPVSIALPEGKVLGLEFRVYTLEQVLRLDQEDKFIGRGTSIQVSCDEGKCLSAHLTWKGAFPGAGPVFVQVRNPQSRWLTFQLLIAGESVSLGPPIPPTPTPTVPPPPPPPPTVVVTTPITLTTPLTVTVPTTTTTVTTPTLPVVVAPAVPVVPSVQSVPPPPTNNSPYFALVVPDNREQTVGPSGSLWYRFGYGGDRSSVLIVLPSGNATGVGFRVYTPDQAANYTDKKFVGIGTTGKIACETGKCTSDDLAWKGAFPVSGNYFIEVVNNTDKERTFRLIIRGDNINIED
ncbi:hypothetical protein ANRL1_02898 [Anaerolineae bacterium]|nr:hypothetical protein ANRL1_02898 [Anaerolineae bacterium]